MNDNILISLLVLGIRSGTVLVMAASGEILTQKSGVVNLGIEGIITMGAMSGFAAAFYSGNPWVGVLAAFLVGCSMAGIHAFFCVSRRIDQTVSGFLLYRGGVILASLLGQILGPGGQSLVGKIAPQFQRVNISGLTGLPIIGEVLFHQELLLYLVYLVAILMWVLLERTRLGLDIKMVGEKPTAAYERGINVRKTRYLCTILGGGLMGIAGSYLSLAFSPGWVDSISGGRGWIVVALVIFSGWNTLAAMIVAVFFGITAVAQYHVGGTSTLVSALLKMVPYVFPLIALSAASVVPRLKKSLRAPGNLGEPLPEEI